LLGKVELDPLLGVDLTPMGQSCVHMIP
jgi:hypothetical protein